MNMFKTVLPLTTQEIHLLAKCSNYTVSAGMAALTHFKIFNKSVIQREVSTFTFYIYIACGF